MSPPASPTDVRGDLALVRGALSKAFELSESCDGMLELLAGLASPASDASARAQLGHKVLQAAELARATLRGRMSARRSMWSPWSQVGRVLFSSRDARRSRMLRGGDLCDACAT